MNLTVLADADALATAAAEMVVALAESAISARGRFRMVLAGGSTPRRLYEHLAASDRLDWERTDLFLGDERCVEPEDERRNDRMARAALPPAASIVSIPAELGPEEGAARYSELLTATIGEDPPVFDLVLLGMGADGHTASLFPGMPDLETDSRVTSPGVAPVEPHERVTLTLRTINAARTVAFLVAGESKADALQRVLAGESLPAALVRPSSLDLRYFVDRAAAGDAA